jgi:hypothetical protein
MWKKIKLQNAKTRTSLNFLELFHLSLQISEHVSVLGHGYKVLIDWTQARRKED